MLQIFRPAGADDEDHRYAVVINEGDQGIEYFDQAGVQHDVAILNAEHTGVEEWVEYVPRPALVAAATAVLSRRDNPQNPDDRRGVLGADGERIGEVWLVGDEWHARYAKLAIAGFDENPPTFGNRERAIGWVLEQDRPRIAKQHEAKS